MKPEDPKRFATAKAFESWLAKNHSSANEIWLTFAKKGSGATSVSYSEAVEVALCYGWIDGQARGLDERFSLQRYTPRGPRSKWSKRNRDLAERLIASGRMKPTGLAAIKRAKANGNWDGAYDSPSTAVVPDDLARVLNKDKKAKAFFEKLDSRNRYAILYRLQDAKKPETRAKRIEKFVMMLREGEKLYP